MIFFGNIVLMNQAVISKKTISDVGGNGNDFVFADAQDGNGTNNANFATPDGSNPRMQMFIFSNAGSPAYQPDSDFDNGVIAHEYGHGWSNRLTGGPAIVDCLQNAEQAGEGWSDYAALMTTTKWGDLSPNLASANIPRGIGTYVLGAATTGAGIRPFRYSYDKANINNTVTYAGVGNASVFLPTARDWLYMGNDALGHDLGNYLSRQFHCC